MITAVDTDFTIPVGIPTRVVLLRRDALEALPSALHAVQLPPGSTGLLVEDARTRLAAGRRVKNVLVDGGFFVNPCFLSDNVYGTVDADDDNLMHVCGAAGADTDFIIGVGSGVINDLAKLAAARVGKPYIAVVTAASVNGYGSPVAAVLQDGIKRTLPAAATDVIVADLDVIATAPREMTRSGFADILSKHSAGADWMLAHLGRNEGYDPRVNELLAPAVQEAASHAETIGRATTEGVTVLMQSLIQSAFAMALAGHSSPASGGEHLLSHYWDMAAHLHHRALHLHGFQVAIATRLCSLLYQRVFQLNRDQINVERCVQRWLPWPKRSKQLRQVHGPLYPIIEAEAKKQYLQRDQLQSELTHIRDNWDQIREAVSPLLLMPDELFDLHQAAAIPTTASAIGQSIDSVSHAFRHAADVRVRFTVLDLAGELGILEHGADEIVTDARI